MRVCVRVSARVDRWMQTDGRACMRACVCVCVCMLVYKCVCMCASACMCAWCKKGCVCTSMRARVSQYVRASVLVSLCVCKTAGRCVRVLFACVRM